MIKYLALLCLFLPFQQEESVFTDYPWLLEYSINENQPFITSERVIDRSYRYGDYVWVEIMDENGVVVPNVSAFDVSTGQIYHTEVIPDSEGQLEYVKGALLEKFTCYK